jgi:hypothetical protein
MPWETPKASTVGPMVLAEVEKGDKYMPGNIELLAYKSLDRPWEGQWVIRLCNPLGKGIIAHDRNLSTALRRAANNLSRMKGGT